MSCCNPIFIPKEIPEGNKNTESLSVLKEGKKERRREGNNVRQREGKRERERKREREKRKEGRSKRNNI